MALNHGSAQKLSRRLLILALLGVALTLVGFAIATVGLLAALSGHSSATIEAWARLGSSVGLGLVFVVVFSHVMRGRNTQVRSNQQDN